MISGRGAEMRTWVAAALVMLLACSACGEGTESRPGGETRPSAFAGTWYPADAQKLRAMVEELLASAQAVPLKGKIVALIAPHAGYIYSGKVAGWSYRQVGKGRYERVIVLAPSHHGAFRGFSIMNVASYSTPLGEVPLDKEACAKLQGSDLHFRDDRLHVVEHAIEIQLPFLQTALGDFKLVPILVGALAAGDAEKIAAALKAELSPKTLVVISSDFTHYGPNYDYMPFGENVEQNLRKLDMGAVDFILKKDYDSYLSYVQKTQATICGRNAIAILLKMLPATAEGRLLRYDTSGHITGDFTNSVSYVSMAFAVAQDAPSGASAEAGDALTVDEKKTLLRIARDTLEQFVRSGRAPEISDEKYGLTPRLKAKAGAFVTVKKHEELRGCIGRIGYPEAASELSPMYQSVALMAVEAAARDPRFEPVRPDELKDIALEISVLSIARKVGGPEDFEVGKQGIIISKGYSGAVFLPQVAPEQGWNRDETLRHLCAKAGLPADEWKKPGMSFFVFTAQVFDESLLRR